MKMYKLLCFLALLFLSSCIEDITDDFPIEEKPVVNSILVADEPIYFEMSANYQTYPQLRKFIPGKLFLLPYYLYL